MRPVTERPVFGVLAATEINGLCLGCLERLGREFASLVATITKWLVFAFSAGTPVISFSSGDLNGIRRFLCNGGFHVCSLVY